MNFLLFIRRESTRSLNKIIFMAGLAGVSNALLLSIINNAAKAASDNEAKFALLLQFILAFTLFILSQKYIMHESTAVVEEVIANVRARMSNKIRKTNVLELEDIGQSEIYNRLTQQTIVISSSAATLIQSVQSAIMLFFVSIYIATLSLPAIIAMVVLYVLGVLFYLRNHKKLRVYLEEANNREIDFFDSLKDILEGIKEIKFNRARSNSTYSFMEQITVKLKNIRISMMFKYINNNIFAQSFYYFLIGVILFILPKFTLTQTTKLAELTASVLFIIGPIDNIVGTIQAFDQVDYAVSNIAKLEVELEEMVEIDEESDEYDDRLEDVREFETLTLKGVHFSYKDQNGNGAFSIGPFDQQYKSGEMVFVVGGNGSGKTTFLKVLSMLYYPNSGSITLDDTQVSPANVIDYRELFSTVFTDFHLSSRLYNLDKGKRKKVRELLKILEIDNKTRLKGDRFTTLDLSTGQRKRLALLIALLEDKPIYIFDEWAADQDPEFRHYFYHTILQQLKDRGKTVIAASHDDRFFHYADRVIKMDYGQVTADFVPREPTGESPAIPGTPGEPTIT